MEQVVGGGELMTLSSFSLNCPELMCGRVSGQLVSAGCCLMVVLMSRAAGCMVRDLRQVATVHIPLHLYSTRLKSHLLRTFCLLCLFLGFLCAFKM